MKDCEKIQELLTGYIDGELDSPTCRLLEQHILGCPECKEEYGSLKRLAAGTSSAMAFDEPPPEVWDSFLDSVYNRIERRTGWTMLWVGLAMLAAYGLFLYVTTDWAPPLAKFVCALPVGGLSLLFVSVLRQRLHVQKNDRYSRDVVR